MSTLLSTAKKELVEQAVEIYTELANDIPSEKEGFIIHFARLGEVLFEIESCKTLSQFIAKIENGDFSMLGILDEGDLEDFLERVQKK